MKKSLILKGLMFLATVLFAFNLNTAQAQQTMPEFSAESVNLRIFLPI